MIVYINDSAVKLFRGCRVIDAVRSFCQHWGLYLDIEQIRVTDAWGNTLSLDSPLEEGSRIHYTPTDAPRVKTEIHHKPFI